MKTLDGTLAKSFHSTVVTLHNDWKEMFKTINKSIQSSSFGTYCALLVHLSKKFLLKARQFLKVYRPVLSWTRQHPMDLDETEMILLIQMGPQHGSLNTRKKFKQRTRICSERTHHIIVLAHQIFSESKVTSNKMDPNLKDNSSNKTDHTKYKSMKNCAIN